jgi:hypothetical protein
MLARQRGERGYEAWAIRLLGEIASHPDHPDAAMAQAHYAAALALASELGMRPLVATSHLGLGKLRHRKGKDEQVNHLSIATTMFGEMGMTGSREQAERELANWNHGLVRHDQTRDRPRRSRSTAAGSHR